MTRRPAVTFAIVCVVAAGGLAAYLLHAGKRMHPAPAAPSPAAAAAPAAPAETESTVTATDSPPAAPAASAAPAAAESTPSAPHGAVAAPRSQRLFFRYNGVDNHYGRVAWVETANLADVHFVDSLRCEVVHVSGGHGICLSAERGVFTTYAATLFDARTFEQRGTFALKGIPSRTRVSADGTLAGLTVFVSGHGYSTLDFSTQTLLIDFASGSVLADLENFKVTHDGVAIDNADFNFWGITFTPDAKNFFATLSTGGKHYLVRGDIAARSAIVIHENVECPSLSPDARRIAYKKRLMVGNRVIWQLHVLELSSGREIALSEKRSIDDQLEWLDNRHVLYSVPSADDGSSPSTDVWEVAVDARSAPQLFLRNAYSPATARGAAR
ncbi:MAG: hypothetical protein ABI821_08710 [Pseudomonadota bacterium]